MFRKKQNDFISMTAKTHFLIGTVSAFFIASSWNNIGNMKEIFITSTMLGSLLPDIDEPNSFIGRRTKIISSPLNSIFGHRTIAHNLIIYFIMLLYAIYSKNMIIIGVSFGAIIHIFCDAITNSGVRGGMYPILDNFTLLPKELRFDTNGFVENIIFLVTSIFFMFYLYRHFVNFY